MSVQLRPGARVTPSGVTLKEVAVRHWAAAALALALYFSPVVLVLVWAGVL